MKLTDLPTYFAEDLSPYGHIQFSRREDGKQEKDKEEDQKPEEAHTLVGKSKGLSSEDFPKLPAIPKTEVSDTQANTIAPPKAEEGGEASDTTEEEPSEEQPINEEENEMQIASTADEVDEDEVVQEELPLSRDPMPEVSPSAVLARDLVRMERWAKNDDDWGMYLLDCRSYD